MKPTLVVMAAGMGSRYGGIKQIDPVGLYGEAILDYSIYDAIRAGFGKIVFIIRTEIEGDVKAFFGDRFEKRITTRFVHQKLSDLPSGFEVPVGRSKPWGTGQAVRCTRDAVTEPFAVINADDFYGREAFGKMAEFLLGLEASSSRFAMVGYRLRNTLSENGSVSRGVCEIDGQGFLKSVEEHVKIVRISEKIIGGDDSRPCVFTGDEIVSMNMFGFTPRLYPLLEGEFADFLALRGTDPSAEFYIPKVVNTLVERGAVRVAVIPSSSPWFGITYKEDKPVVQAGIRALIGQGEYPERLWT
jgi:NDP-sugar pyrophosphorylase family protein